MTDLVENTWVTYDLSDSLNSLTPWQLCMPV